MLLITAVHTLSSPRAKTIINYYVNGFPVAKILSPESHSTHAHCDINLCNKVIIVIRYYYYYCILVLGIY